MLVQEPLQQPFGCSRVAANLSDFVEHISILIDGAPEIAALAVDRNDHFAKMPYVSWAWLLSLQPASVVRSKFPSPDANGFVGDNDPAFEQQLLNARMAAAT